VLNYLLSDGIICLLPALSDTNSVSSTASSWAGFRTLPARALGNLKLSLDEFIEFIILGFITMVVQGLLSFHNLKKVRKPSLTTFTAAAIAKSIHDKTGGNHTNI